MIINHVREKIRQLAQERILILDGAMGSMLQAQAPPNGCNDLLCLTKPACVQEIHEAYLKAGADIIETCSFNANAVSLADYGLANSAYEINVAAARLARKAADSFSTPDKPRFIAGSMGPTSKSASICQDMNDPGKRAIGWDELEAAYYDNARGLLDGGADLFIIETIFDTLNAKAAIFAVRRLAEERNIDLPIIVSATVSNTGGRLLTGQTVEAFCVSVLHADPLALGLNCSFGAEKLKPQIAGISAAVSGMVIAFPNAGLPNHQGIYDESPESMADNIEEYLRERLVNIIGGCCGSTPAHIAAISERAKKYPPRLLPVIRKKTLLSGLEVLELDHGCFYRGKEDQIKAEEDDNFLQLISEGKYEDAVEIACDKAEDGAIFFNVCLADKAEKTDITRFLNYSLQYPALARLPAMIGNSVWDVVEAGLKCLPGKGIVSTISIEDGEEEFLRRARLSRAYGAAVVATTTRSFELFEKAGFPKEDIIEDIITDPVIHR
ncbi:MAG: homocysteine S-methyltransferase family protein [Treponema sp.]|jgi:5-methyltetrahydrofolate--homocysteine methyltransferase|nr:homocysteine S-methyltransferase family protein [Treponema sp.]